MLKLLSALFILLVLTIAPPARFPSSRIIEVPQGTDLQTLAIKLKSENMIRSAFGFRIAATFIGAERGLKAGHYSFSRRESALDIALRIKNGDHQIETIKLTVPEGLTVEEISNLFGEKFLFFDNALFERITPEGYLFPDTYFVPITATASGTIKLMADNFKRQVKASTTREIIIMASLLEAELKSREDREKASDILWKRLRLGMPLQVDSYMWTYENPGLPERPINNPGLVSIEAALHPTSTPYLYFLTGKDGKTYYARTHDEHVVNKQKYLR